MAIDLNTFASGDTDYIPKMNANVSAIKQAIDALQLAIDAADAGGAVSAGLMMMALFNNADALIGPDAYRPTLSASTATVAPGTMYLADLQTVVSSIVGASLSFGGQTANTYYIVIDGTGTPTRRTTFEPGSAYSVVWNGGAFVGDPVRVAPAFFDTNEAAEARVSTSLTEPPTGSPPVGPGSTPFDTLDARLEAGEEVAMDAKALAEDVLDRVVTLETAETAPRVRKVGCSISEAGVIGAIQVDFYGTIVGWSVIGNAVGDLSVEVSVAASSPPPAVPTVPNPTTDKISASAPIVFTAAQSASRAEAGVASWDTTINQWDVVQFKCITLVGPTRATLYLLIEEISSP